MGELTDIPGKNTSTPAAPVSSSYVKGRAVLEAEVLPAPQKKKRNYKTRRASARQRKAAILYTENVRNQRPKSDGEVLREAGYTQEVSEQPGRVIESDSFQKLLEEVLPDAALAETHERLLKTRKIEHMVFPLGQEGEDDPNLSGATPNEHNPMDDLTYPVERTTLSDQEIKDMLAEVNCIVKRIVHGQTARHVYFWAHDAKAQASALELAYKLKGRLQKDGTGSGGINFNFGTQNFIGKAEAKT